MPLGRPPKLTLEAYTKKLRAEIAAFSSDWRKKQVNPDMRPADWPDKMTEGEWQEEFANFLITPENER